MTDKPDPLPTVAGTRTEGTLLETPIKRISAKSAFLRKLEKKQREAAAKVNNISYLKGRK